MGRSRSRSVRKERTRREERSRSRREDRRKPEKREPEKREEKRKAAKRSASTESSGDAPAWASDAGGAAEEDAGRRGGGEDLNLSGRVALLEVDMAALKAENQELRKQLIAFLGGRAAAPPAKASAAPAARRREEERREVAKEPEVQPEEDKKNAVLLSNDVMEAYNESITNNIPPEKRLPLVDAKMQRFFDNFHEEPQAFLLGGGTVLKDKKNFEMRYGCVFRESGAKLKGTCTKRFYYDSVHRNTYVLDFETHESLVTALAGTPPSGKLGVREPRTEYLIVLYEEKGGKLTRMWIKPDTDKLGIRKGMAEEDLLKTEIVQAFEVKIAELRESPKAGPRIFQDYLDIPTIG